MFWIVWNEMIRNSHNFIWNTECRKHLQNAEIHPNTAIHPNTVLYIPFDWPEGKFEFQSPDRMNHDDPGPDRLARIIILEYPWSALIALGRMGSSCNVVRVGSLSVITSEPNWLSWLGHSHSYGSKDIVGWFWNLEVRIPLFVRGSLHPQILRSVRCRICLQAKGQFGLWRNRIEFSGKYLAAVQFGLNSIQY
jgi:hypothetical protein